MKTLLKILFSIISMALIFVACDEDDIGNNQDPIHSPVVQFEVGQSTIQENDSAKTITVSFSKPALREGSIKVTFDTAFTKFLRSEPDASGSTIMLPVKKNDTKAIFKVSPVNNTKKDGQRAIVFIITQATNQLHIGERKTYTLSIRDDDEAVPVKDSYVNFIASNLTLPENESAWREIQIHVSEFATANGNVLIEANSEKAIYGSHYVTEPAMSNNLLALTASQVEPVLKFKIRTLDNNLITGNVSIRFKVRETSGNLKKGATLEDLVSIDDDELEGMPKGYETSGGGWGMKKTYEYNSKGDIASVLWENYTPNLSTGTHTYYYNEVDQLIRVNTDPGHDITYHWENGKIIKQEKVRDGVVRSYSEYGYDDQGNVGSYRTFYLQPDGTFSLSDVTILLYYLDGNLYKKIVYYPTANSDEELVVISETTFDSYLDADNPFPMVEVLPNMKTQKKLPSTYRHQANGHDLLYNLSYAFRPDGKVGKRTAVRETTTEIAVYHYY